MSTSDKSNGKNNGRAAEAQSDAAGALDQHDGESASLIRRLATMRDELRVQLNLAGSEVRTEWEKLEERWHALQSYLGHIGAETGRAGKDLGAATKLIFEEATDREAAKGETRRAIKLLASELKRGYERIQAAF